MFLFEHDRRLLNIVGANHYVRWMDDQNIAVKTETYARSVVRLLTRSLAHQRLVLNSGKTKFLSPVQVSDHFHLDANEQLDGIDLKIKAKHSGREIRMSIKAAWNCAFQLEGKGNWDKILKRFYGFAGRLGMKFLRRRAYNDLITYPLLAPRIFEYYVALSDYGGLLELFDRMIEEHESIYESVENCFFETVLNCNVPDHFRKPFREFCGKWLKNPSIGSGRPFSRGSAALCLYWLGDKRSVKAIKRVLDAEGIDYPASSTRALVSAYIALAPEQLDYALGICARISNGELSSVSRFIHVLSNDGSLRCALPRITQRVPYSTQIPVFEARTWLRLEVLSLSKATAVKKWLRAQELTISKCSLGDCEKRAFARWRKRLYDQP
ncbi:MAG: hypothetical protein IPO31_00255 [Candidatus Obscuribacter sp.]|nr:hypothetical protein [Candidatus Obscuribacter sp.]